VVEDLRRFDAINKHVDNTFLSIKILKDVTEALAQELELKIKALQESGDDYNFVPGLLNAAKLIRMKEELL